MLKIFKNTLFIALFLLMVSMKDDSNQWKKIQVSELMDEIHKMENFYKKNRTYSMLVSHATYVGHTSEKSYEKTDGFIIKQENKLHSFLLGIETIQNEQYNVVIDTSMNTIAVSDPTKENNEMAMPLNAALAMKKITECKKLENKQSAKQFRIEFLSTYNMQAEEIKMGNDYSLKELTLFYRQKFKVDPDNNDSPMEQPKAKITVKEQKLNPKIDPNEFKVSKFFTSDKSGRLYVTAAYKEFELSDLRISKNIK